MNKISFSIVTYQTDLNDLEKLTDSIARCTLTHYTTIVDNSNSESIAAFCSERNLDYVANEKNVGFGAAHNVVLKKHLGKVDYHIAINPDVYFDKNTFEPLINFMDKDESIGLCTPKILYPNGDTQYLCKLVPSPADLIARRFLPSTVKNSKKTKPKEYEMRNFDYDKNLEVPILSGCCMVLRDEALSKCGLFDERFFLYLEDVDLSRRIYRYYTNMHFAGSFIYHHYQKSSYKKLKSTKLHISSALKYFTKWGWVRDEERNKMNKKARKANKNKKLE